MIRKIIGRVNAEVALYVALFVVLTIPRTIGDISPVVAAVLNIVKVGCFGAVVILSLIRLKRISRITKIFLAYFAWVLFTTLVVNHTDPMVALKTYSLNAGIFLLVELVLQSERRNSIVRAFSDYFLILLLLNTIEVVSIKIFDLPEINYILGMDNRFILYVLPTIAGYYLLDDGTDKKMKWKIWVVYLVGFLSTVLTWSVASFCVIGLMALCELVVRVWKGARLNARVILVLTTALSVGVVVFRVHNILRPIITSGLHKSMSLSYRTYMWDVGLNRLSSNPVGMLFGFGFFDYSGVLSVLPYVAARVNHFHNILVDVCFAGGLVGLAIYGFGLWNIASSIDKMKFTIKKKRMAIMLAGVSLLLVVESFELYQVYYYLIALMGIGASVLAEKVNYGVKEENEKS